MLDAFLIFFLLFLSISIFFLLINDENDKNKEYFDIILGKTKEGVICYKNEGNVEGNYFYPPYNIYTGEKWECVEFVRRYLIKTRNVTFSQVNSSYDVFHLPYFINLYEVLPYEIQKYKNGEVIPVSGDIIIFHVDNEQYGHICVIDSVKEQSIQIVEQNYDNKSWGNKDYSRIIYYNKNDRTMTSPDTHEKVYGIIRL